MEFKKGQYVFLAGDAPGHVHLVESGKVILTRESQSGKAFTYLVAVRGTPLNAVTWLHGPAPLLFRPGSRAGGSGGHSIRKIQAMDFGLPPGDRGHSRNHGRPPERDLFKNHGFDPTRVPKFVL